MTRFRADLRTYAMEAVKTKLSIEGRLIKADIFEIVLDRFFTEEIVQQVDHFLRACGENVVIDDDEPFRMLAPTCLAKCLIGKSDETVRRC